MERINKGIACGGLVDISRFGTRINTIQNQESVIAQFFMDNISLGVGRLSFDTIIRKAEEAGYTLTPYGYENGGYVPYDTPDEILDGIQEHGNYVLLKGNKYALSVNRTTVYFRGEWRHLDLRIGSAETMSFSWNNGEPFGKKARKAKSSDKQESEEEML